jgi:hypothetical protein
MDKNTVGLQPQNQGTLQELMGTGFFKLELDAAKFAMAIAITKGVPPGETTGADTKWNVGTLDPSNEIRELLPALFAATTEPYRLSEHLINEGLRLIREERDRRGRMEFGDLLVLARPQTK